MSTFIFLILLNQEAKIANTKVQLSHSQEKGNQATFGKI